MLDHLHPLPTFDCPNPELAEWFLDRDDRRERSCGELEALVRELAARPDLWRQLAARAGTPHGVAPYTDAFLEAALVSWPRSGQHPVHDHGPSRGAVAVVEGALTERRMALGALVPPTRVRRQGSVWAFEANEVHAVNPAGADRATVTVHAYSPPRAESGYYSVDRWGFVSRRADGPRARPC